MRNESELETVAEQTVNSPAELGMANSRKVGSAEGPEIDGFVVR